MWGGGGGRSEGGAVKSGGEGEGVVRVRARGVLGLDVERLGVP